MAKKKAVRNINSVIGPELIGDDCRRQREIDKLMIELDGTENKSKLGANAILAVSMAVCKAAAQAYSFGGAQYGLAFNDRTEKLGWSKEQNGAYTRNECLLTERLKWGHHEKPAWTTESTNLEQFKR